MRFNANPASRVARGGAIVSKRHQSSRRRSYGRRQHELHERDTSRRHNPLSAELDVDGWEQPAPSDPLAFMDPRAPRLRFAVGE
jgi:hypothetical protein